MKTFQTLEVEVSINDLLEEEIADEPKEKLTVVRIFELLENSVHRLKIKLKRPIHTTQTYLYKILRIRSGMFLFRVLRGDWNIVTYKIMTNKELTLYDKLIDNIVSNMKWFDMLCEGKFYKQMYKIKGEKK